MPRKRTRKGYSIFQRAGKGSWYVSWKDGNGEWKCEVASPVRSIAEEVGRAKAREADRVRGGVVSAREIKIKNAGELAISEHLNDWKKHLQHKQNTAKHVRSHYKRVKTLLEAAGVNALSEMRVESIEASLNAIAQRHTPQTANHYRTALRGFQKWCIEIAHRMSADASVKTPKMKTAGDAFRRYAFSADELAAILTATETRKAKTPFRGRDRAMYYRLMAYTGLRRNEAASVTPESFDLLSNPPTVTVEASYSKRRERDTQPMPHDLAVMLRAWLADKLAGKPVFNISPHMNLERVFLGDCTAAGIVPDEDVVLGVHSLRRFYITTIVRAAGLAVGQDLARHSTPALTKKYLDLTMEEDYRKGIDALPPVKAAEQKKRKIG